jgi:hypothetical protein
MVDNRINKILLRANGKIMYQCNYEVQRTGCCLNVEVYTQRRLLSREELKAGLASIFFRYGHV